MKNSLKIVFISTLMLLSAALSAADIEAGKTSATTCTGCHGIANYNNVYPVYKVPKLAGQNEKYLVTAINGYKNGERKHPTMEAQAASLSDQDIANIAAWFASLK